MNYFSNDVEYQALTAYKPKQINELIHEKMYLIVGDFYGIQKFIFEGLTTKNASKVMRAKSAFIQLFTVSIAEYICHRLNIETKHILTKNAGKFEILSPCNDATIMEDIQNQVDNFFMQNYFGTSGLGIISVECSKNELEIDYKSFRNKITKAVESKKFTKFNLHNATNPVLKYENDISNQNLCPICNVRKAMGKNCDICNTFVNLGGWLVSTKTTISAKNDLGLDFLGGFDFGISLTPQIKSYVATDTKGEPLAFSDLAELSCETTLSGIKALGILKADVDGMGNYLKNSDVTESFDRFDYFSNVLDSFFSHYIPQQIHAKFKHTYVVFAGGDDLFLVGSWDVILELARWIEQSFKKFVNSNELTISFGIAIAKPSIPISYLAEHTEELLDTSKSLNGKDAITMFDETVKWVDYQKTYDKLNEVFGKILPKDINTAFLYRLLEFCEMSKKVKFQHDNHATIWKSKLRYSYGRNNLKLGNELYQAIDVSIEKFPSETKMFLSELIYKRRD